MSNISLKKYIQDNSSWFDFEDSDDRFVLSTRENGNTGDETVGIKDLKEAKSIVKTIKSEFPNNKIEIEEVDEFVYINIYKEESASEAKTEPTENEYITRLKEALFPKYKWNGSKTNRVVFHNGSYHKEKQFESKEQLLEYLLSSDFISEFWYLSKWQLEAKIYLKDCDAIQLTMYTNYHDVNRYDWEYDRISSLHILGDETKEIANSDLKLEVKKQMQKLISSIKSLTEKPADNTLKYKYKSKALAIKLNMQGSKKLGEVKKTSDGIVTEIDAVLHKEFIDELVGVETTISNSSIGAQHLKHAYKYFQYKEEFVALFLDRRNKVIGWHNASKGGATSVVVDPKQILGIAVKINAQGLIISHNHPSGETTPSSADIALTKTFIAAGKTLDIAVLDHVIVALVPDKEGRETFKYRSLREQGDINQW